MSNDHREKDQLHLYDLITMFILKAPDMEKALAAILVLFGPKIATRAVEYKQQFKSYQDWRNHLVAALDNAQEKVDASE